MAAQHGGLASRVRSHDFYQRIAYRLAGEKGQEVVTGDATLMPTGFAEGRYVRCHINVLVSFKGAGQPAAEVRGGFITEGIESMQEFLF
jgi:hypothetical protein